MDNKNLNSKINNIDDETKNGEFISSFFVWNTLDGQKEKAHKLENATKKRKKE